jgi:hypothetical protein
MGATSLVAGSVAVVVVAATIGRGWSWTGFAGEDSFWSWAKLLAQPLALAVVTLELILQGRLRRSLATAGTVLLAGLAAVAVGGYAMGWSWTGLRGIALWDWLHLLLFPVVLVVYPVWAERGAPVGRRAGIAALGALVAASILVVAGYRLNWEWTGFSGNTFRNWLALLIAPFLVPLACSLVSARVVADRRSPTTVASAATDRTLVLATTTLDGEVSEAR